MRGWCSITPFDGVADWCCRASAELLRKLASDGWLVCKGDVYFNVNLHICMYLRDVWLPLARTSPHLDETDLAV